MSHFFILHHFLIFKYRSWCPTFGKPYCSFETRRDENLEEDWRNQEKNWWYHKLEKEKWRKSSKGKYIFSQWYLILTSSIFIENFRHPTWEWVEKTYVPEQLHDFKAEVWRKEKSSGCFTSPKEGRGQTSKNDQVIKWAKKETKSLQNRAGK